MRDSSDLKDKSNKKVIGIDVGTTSLKACIFDVNCKIIRKTQKLIPLECEELGDSNLRSEIDPDQLWQTFVDSLKELVSSVDDVSTIRSIGISCQRGTFICWNKETGLPCHKLVTWKDCRGKELCKKWNESFTIKIVNALGYLLYTFTRRNRFRAASVLMFLKAMVTFRLIATIEQRADMKLLLDQGKLAFGCLDTWLIHKLSNGQVLLAEPSNASVTGLLDPYIMDWGINLLKFLSFPTQILPSLKISAGEAISFIDEGLLGIPLHIGGLIGDQQAAAFSCGCWNPGDVSISLGTGVFVDVNTGANPHSSLIGLYPVVGWKFPSSCCFLAEGYSSDATVALEWAKSIGLFKDISKTSEIVEQAHTSDLCFIPAFGALNTPINNEFACTAFMNIRSNTTKAQMLRSILESIAFRVYQIWNAACNEISFISNGVVRCCGGIAANNFICQTISTLLNRHLCRMNDERYTSARGAALLAGLSSDVWTTDDMRDMVLIDRTFIPDQTQRPKLLKLFSTWEKAMNRCLDFH